MENLTIPQFDANKEYTNGEKFVYNDLVFVCKEKTIGHGCSACVFSSVYNCGEMICSTKDRKDRSSVYFDFEEELKTTLQDAPVNSVINYHGKKFKIIKTVLCEYCFFRKFYCNSLPCLKQDRKDKTNVSFMLVGEYTE